MPEVRPGIYQHYKGGFYQVIGEGVHTETREEEVIYLPLYGPNPDELQVRPKVMFLEEVIVDGITIPRFRFINDKV